MKAPECRVCGKKHWSSEPHVFEEVREDSTGRTEREQVVEKAEEAPLGVVPENGQVARNRRYRDKHREKYNTYMREYMRKRRG